MNEREIATRAAYILICWLVLMAGTVMILNLFPDKPDVCNFCQPIISHEWAVR